jgi:Heterokaryon incompatibility protein (HET)
MATEATGLYRYGTLPTDTTFRLIELHPGAADDTVSCALHVIDWPDPPPYEAISYAWRDAKARALLICDGKELEVTKSLLTALKHFRYADRSRYLWADAVW